MSDEYLSRLENFQKLIFVDETGTEGITNLGNQGITNFYIEGALVTASSNVKELEDAFASVRKEMRFKGEMGSKYVGKKLKRRIKVLDALFSVEGYTVDLLVVDKSKLSGGHAFPKSFIKDIAKRLYSEYRGQLCDILIVSDVKKGKKFNDDFEKYIRFHIDSTFWAKREKVSVDSEDSSCVQAIDFIAGSLLRALEFPNEYQEISNHIPRNRVSHYNFPEVKPRFLFDIGKIRSQEYNPEISDEAFAIVLDYIKRNDNSKEESEKVRIACLKRLQREFIFGDHFNWVSSKDLVETVRLNYGLEKKIETLRTQIGKLKERGVLIASRMEGGYKLPCCINDMELFVNNLGSKIFPMIDRMSKARRIIRNSSSSQFDILADKPVYKIIIDSYDEAKLEEIRIQSTEPLE